MRFFHSFSLINTENTLILDQNKCIYMGKQNDYEGLESEIGNLGGEEQVTEQKAEKSLGKLKYDHGTRKRELSDEEKRELEAFRARSDSRSTIGRGMGSPKLPMGDPDDGVVPVGDGWIPVDRMEMGLRSYFYPEDWQFAVRPATVNAIKNWTSVDEERMDQVNNAFNDMIKTCVKITSSEGGVSWENLNSWDRFWFVMKIREYTFTHGESKVQFTDTCSECDEDITYELTSAGLHYEYPDDDIIEKHWDGKVWKINPREYDVDADEITLYLPTLGKDNAVITWATNRYRQTGKVDEHFAEVIPWLIPKASRDPQMFDRQIDKIYKDYKSWSVEFNSFIRDVIRNLTIMPSNKLRTICPCCGREAVSNLRFPDGIKVIFNVATRAKKFGSR